VIENDALHGQHVIDEVACRPDERSDAEGMNKNKHTGTATVADPGGGDREAMAPFETNLL
jgi:hypothetical protein